MKLRTMLICIILSLMSVSAFAGTITGKVTDASSQPLQGISVQVYDTATDSAITVAGTTDVSGNYSIPGIDAGSYKVIFFGKNGAGAPYAQKWYGGGTSYSTATAITVTFTGTTSNINGTLSGTAQPAIDLQSANKVSTTVVKLPITLVTGGAAIAATGMDIVFDPAKVLTITSYDPADTKKVKTPGPAAVAAGKTISDSKPAANIYRIGLSGSNTNVIEDGIIAWAYVTLAGDTSSAIALTNTPSASDPSGSAVTVSGIASSITFPDLSAPVVTTFTVPATATSTIISPITFSATDNVAVTGYLINESATPPSATDSGWTTTAPTDYKGGGTEGTRTLYAWAKDFDGNISASKQATIVITFPDTTAPVVGTFTIPSTAKSLTIPVTTISATDNKAVTGYLITATSGKPSATATGWSSTVPASYTVTASIPEATPTVVTLYAWAKDAAGNVSAGKSASVTITLDDTQKPVLSSFSISPTSTSQTVTVQSISATDNKGVTGYLITESNAIPDPAASGWSTSAPTSYTVSGTLAQGVDISKTLYAWAKDAANNVSVATNNSATVTIHLPDTTKPVVASTFTVPATATSATVSVSNFTATDNVQVTGYLITESSSKPAAGATGWSTTAPTSYTFQNLPVGVATDKTLYGWAKDEAGNVSDSGTGTSGTVKVTLNGPSVSFTGATLPDGTSTKNSAVTIEGTVSGNGTTLKSMTIQLNNGTATPLTYGTDGKFSTSIVLVAGDNTITIVATDNNDIATTVTRKITLNPDLADLAVTAPTTGSFTKEAIAQVTGTIGAPQSTILAITVNGAAVQSVLVDGDNFTANVNLAVGPNNIVVTATDSVTGTHTAAITVTSDPTAPTLNIIAPVTAYATPKDSVVISGTVDETVTSATVTIKVDGGQAVTVPVTDKAFSYTVQLPTIKTYSIVVTATDQSGNAATVTRGVVRVYPSGSFTDGVAAPSIVDVQKVMRFALGFETPTADEKIFVNVAPVVNGKPAPDTEVDGGDALVVLEKVLGKFAW